MSHVPGRSGGAVINVSPQDGRHLRLVVRFLVILSSLWAGARRLRWFTSEIEDNIENGCNSTPKIYQLSNQKFCYNINTIKLQLQKNIPDMANSLSFYPFSINLTGQVHHHLSHWMHLNVLYLAIKCEVCWWNRIRDVAYCIIFTHFWEILP